MTSTAAGAYGKITDGAGLSDQSKRMSVSGFRRVKTIEQLKGTSKYDILVTEQKREWLKKEYENAVSKGDISALTGFDHYMKVAENVQQKLVGVITSDNVEITGYRTHFIDRIIGGYEDKREPVDVQDVKNVLTGSAIHIVDSTNKGHKSRRYSNAICHVTLNPETGMLVQASPRKKG